MRFLLFSILFFLIHITAFAQDWQHSGAYMVPSKVYVGDRASLVIPLPGIAGNGDVEIGKGPCSPDIVLHHVILERRPTGSFLKIEFSAYNTGILELPPFDVAGEIFNGLKIEISSILSPDESGMVISGPALPLAVPGTSLLIYGTISAILMIMLLSVWILFWGRKRINGWLAAWKRRRLLVSMAGTEKRLRKALQKGTAGREILDILSTEFRGFLSRFTGENYWAMTAGEIGRLKDIAEGADILGSKFLGKFFNYCDGFRFRGGEINDGKILALLSELDKFLAELNLAIQRKAA